MSLVDDKFKRRLARRLALAGQRKVRPRLSRLSDTLARSLVIEVRRIPGDKGNVSSRLHIPHYWAVYAHDGRKPFRKGRYMVWFRNPRLDPRLQGGKSPKRASQLRSLTRDQWIAALRLRNQWIRLGGDPFDAPVIITKVIRRATPPNRFFGNAPGDGMFGFGEIASRLATAEFSRHVKSVMGDALFERDEAVGRL